MLRQPDGSWLAMTAVAGSGATSGAIASRWSWITAVTASGGSGSSHSVTTSSGGSPALSRRHRAVHVVLVAFGQRQQHRQPVHSPGHPLVSSDPQVSTWFATSADALTG